MAMDATVVPGVGATWINKQLPVPEAGPGQVLVRVRACGVCANDVHAARGRLPFPTHLPAVPGHEVVGEVVEVGAGVSAPAVGDRVGVPWVQRTCGRCDYCLLGRPLSGQAALCCTAPSTTGFSVPGGQADYLLAEASAAVALPGELPDELAAPVLCAGYTAFGALRIAQPRPGDRVAVLGIGAVGHLAVQFAVACGHEVIAITHTADKRTAALEFGASAVVTDGTGLHAAGGADIVLATGSSYSAASDALRGLRPDGRLVLTGLDAPGEFSLAPSGPFFAKRHRIIGSTHNGPEDLRGAIDLVAAGKCTPVVETYSPARIMDAVDRIAAGAVRFRAVVVR